MTRIRMQDNVGATGHQMEEGRGVAAAPAPAVHRYGQWGYRALPNSPGRPEVREVRHLGGYSRFRLHPGQGRARKNAPEYFIPPRLRRLVASLEPPEAFWRILEAAGQSVTPPAFWRFLEATGQSVTPPAPLRGDGHGDGDGGGEGEECMA